MLIPFSSFVDEFCKLAAQPVSKEEADKSLNRLRQIEQFHDIGTIGRSAAVGSAVMPVANMAARTVAGTQQFLKPGATPSLRNPASIAKSINWQRLGRQATADAMAGSIGGGLLPLARERVETNAQKAKLKNYISQQDGQTDKNLRGKITEYVGV